MEMGKTMFEVMKMRKNNKQNPFPLRKYYGAMIIGFVFFLGIMAYYSATFRQRRDQAKQEVSLEEESIGANNSVTQEKTKTTTQDKKETETTAQMKRTMSESVTYNGTSKLTWPIKGNIILPYSVNSTFFSGPLIIFCARKPMRAAPAVWELEGPIMFGPITSNTLIKDILILLWLWCF